MGLEPDIGQQLSQPVHRLGRESAEDIPKVSEGVDVVVLTVPVMEYRTAAVRPPRSLPRNVQFFRLSDIPP